MKRLSWSYEVKTGEKYSKTFDNKNITLQCVNVGEWCSGEKPLLRIDECGETEYEENKWNVKSFKNEEYICLYKWVDVFIYNKKTGENELKSMFVRKYIQTCDYWYGDLSTCTQLFLVV